MLIGGVTWIAGACWFMYWIVGNPLDELALIRYGQTAPGFIIEAMEEPHDGDEGGTQWLHSATYQYRVGERDYTQSTKSKSGRLSEALRDLKNPDPIEVEYLPDNPAVSRIKGDGNGSILEWSLRTGGLGALLLFVCVSPGFVFLQEAARQFKELRWRPPLS